MFKTGRWKGGGDKNKITALFKLHFHLTQVSEFGGNGVVLSMVAAENRKPTVKLEKCVIRDNVCYWDNPVYETVKFVQDPRTGKIQDRIYNFIISTGSHKGSVVGEFCVNMGDYLTSTKACTVACPFNNNSNSYFHISIQRIQENGHQRDLEENEDQKMTMERRSLKRQSSNGNMEDGVKMNSVEDEHLRRNVPLFPGLNGIRRGSSGSDITVSGSDSSCGLDTPREIGATNNNVSGYQDQQRARWDLAIVPVNGLSTDSSTNSPRDAFSSDRSHMGVDDSAEKLKTDFVALSRKTEMLELELQTLRKQIVKENKKGQDLLKEISRLKEERDALKDERVKLKTSQKRADDFKVKNKLLFEGDPWNLLEEIREELNYEKDLNANLRLQLHKTQESNAELILAVQDLEEMLEKNNGSHLPNRSASSESAIEFEDSLPKSQSDDDEDQKALEELLRKHSNAQETYLLEQKIMDLSSELEMYRRDKDELEMQMEQLALDYEILKQENHEFSSKLEQCHLQEQLKLQYESSSSYATITSLEAQREKLQNELKEQSQELSHSLATIKELEARNWSQEQELKKQVERLKSDNEAVARAQMEQEDRAARAEEALNESATTINELEVEIQKLKKEYKQQLEEMSHCLVTMNEIETRNHNLEDELEKQTLRSKADIEALAHAKKEQEHRELQAKEAVRHSNATIDELGSRIKELENELQMQSEESSGTLAKLKELEAHFHNLEEELEKQAEGFEADLEVVTRAKVEQEQRAIRAEETLKLMRWKNANTAARIQDEFKRLSRQMQSSFEASEKVANKALTEASELRLQNRRLQDMLQKANEELQSTQDDYEAKIQELYGQINMKTTQMEQMVVEFHEKSKQFEYRGKHADEPQESISVQFVELRSEIERLTSENNLLGEQANQGEKLKSELEQMKTLMKERDFLVQGENMEKDDLRDTIASMKEAAAKSLKEINELRHLKDNKEQAVMKLHSEVETLRVQCDNMKHSLYEDELEKEKLRKLVFQLKADLKKKDEVISSIEKKSKENSGRVHVHDRTRSTFKNTKSEQLQRGCKEVGAKEVATLKEKIKLLEGQINLKETALEKSNHAFLAKESSLHSKIEELELRLGSIGQSTSGPAHDKLEGKVSVGMQADFSAVEVSSSGDMPEASITSENLNDKDVIIGNVQTSSSDTEPKAPDNNSEEQKRFDILFKERVLLKERNNCMEIELKEMHERYSDMSLKFAEVEGERQQLVMKLRNLKNAKKS